jgi:hypothetical protein
MKTSWMAAVAVVAGIASTAADAAAADWPQLGFSARRTANSTAETALSASNVGGLQLQWQKSWKCGGTAPPVVAGGRVYVGSTDRVCVFDAATGATLLQIAAGDSTDASPAVATISGKRRLFVASLDGTLYSFAANTGRLLWKVQTGGPVHSSPAVDGGRVYVGSEDGRLYAVDGVTGTVVWSQSLGAPVYGSAAVGFGAVYVVAGAHLWAFETATGAERFGADYSFYEPAGDNAATPAVASDSHYGSGGAVFFTNGWQSDAWLLRADPLTGAVTSCTQYSGSESPRRAMVAIGHGIVYFQTLQGLIERNVYYCSSRIGGRDGYSLNDAFAWLPGSASFTGAAYANGVVYSGRTAFPPVFGRGLPPLWSAGSAASSSVVADGRVYVLVDGKLAAYGLPPA